MSFHVFSSFTGVCQVASSFRDTLPKHWDHALCPLKLSTKLVQISFTHVHAKLVTLPQAGSTATTCLVLGSRLYIANVGDSRTVLCRGGKLRLASQDHKPSRADEQERVHRAGGFVAHRRVRHPSHLDVIRCIVIFKEAMLPIFSTFWSLGGFYLEGLDKMKRV